MKRSMHSNQPIVTDLESPGLSNPGQRLLHHVTDLAQSAAVRRTHPSQMIFDASLFQSFSVADGSIRSVAVQRSGLATGTSTRSLNRWDAIEQPQRLPRIRTVGFGDSHRQRRRTTINQQVAFCAFFGPICGIFACQRPPKTARILWLSTHAFCQSINPLRPRRFKSAWSNFFQTPRRCQYRMRRQQVTPEPQPISWGSISQGIPLRSTKTMPVRHARSSTGGRPRLPGLALCGGSRGQMASHSSPETRGADMRHLQFHY
jgi:hypothetical protein